MSFSFAQTNQSRKVRGEYEAVSLAYYSLDEACQLCYDYARKEAVIAAFGEGVISRNVLIMDENGVDQMKTVQETFPLGTWVKTLNQGFDTIEQEGKKRQKKIYIKCWIEGIIKEIARSPFPIQAAPRVSPSPDSSTIPPTLENESGTKQYQFKHESDFFLDVSSPEQGFLKVFYTDFTDVWQLFPYRSMPLHNKDQKAKTLLLPNRKYCLFDPSQPGFPISKGWVDPVQLISERAIDLDKVIIVLTKPYISSPNIIEEAGEFPAVPYNDFIKWMEGHRQRLGSDFSSKELFILLQK
ncbi:MAG: hypothetical protein AAFW00_21110 [Bacteroidota bacterium]